MTIRLLVVDDDLAMCELVQDALDSAAFTVTTAQSAPRALELLETAVFDVVVTDLELGGVSGLELCQRVLATHADLPVVVITAYGSLDTAIAAIRVGAYDFINKPLDIQALAHSVRRAAEHARLEQEVKRLRESRTDIGPTDEFIGESAGLRRVFEMIAQVSETDASVIISGESGTGKELVARALHRRSSRSGPFVAINCAAMPAALLESELFGHVKGAFTDARTAREGLFLRANGGTLLLDEIGEMPLEMQAKLLRVLQESKVRPVGGDREIEFDTRILAATNRDIESEIEEGNFREDLYYRLNVVRIHVPPLRSRGRDVLLLAQSFVERIAKQTGKSVLGIASSAAQKLLEYDWPGNVRELENSIERAVVLTKFEDITVDDLPEKIRQHDSGTLVVAGDNPEEMPTLAEMERRYVERVLKVVSGNKTHAARVLGLDRRTLYRKLERFEREQSESD